MENDEETSEGVRPVVVGRAGDEGSAGEGYPVESCPESALQTLAGFARHNFGGLFHTRDQRRSWMAQRPFDDGSAGTPKWTIRAPDSRVLGVAHGHWHGIRNATYQNFQNVLEIYEFQQYDETRVVADEIVGRGFATVVINGYPPALDRLCAMLKLLKPDIRLFVLFHGSPTQHAGQPSEGMVLNQLFALQDTGMLDGVGFVKEGLNKIFCELGLQSFHLPNRIPAAESNQRALAACDASDPDVRRLLDDLATRRDGPRIGVFTKDLSWIKNPINQFLAALAVKQARLYVNVDTTPLFYLRRFEGRFFDCGMIRDRGAFLTLLGGMDVNLYVSLTECYPMTVIESLSLGVPCLTAKTNHIFSGDAYLYERLVVLEPDNPHEIYVKLKGVLDELAEIKARLPAFVEKLRQRNDAAWRGVFDD